MEEISASAAAALLKDQPDNTLLLDVREAMELKMAAINNALHIPMGETPARLTDIDRDKTIICMCHIGGRSAQVAGYLSSLGYENVKNMTGGIDAWSTTVDNSVPRY